MIGLDGRFARADRSCQDLEIHLVGSGLGTDLALPFPQKVDHGLLVPEAGVDLPACHEHFSSPVGSRVISERGADSTRPVSFRAPRMATPTLPTPHHPFPRKSSRPH